MDYASGKVYIPESEMLSFERLSAQSNLSQLHALHRDPKVMAFLGSTENVLPATRFTLQRMLLENERFPHLGHWFIFHGSTKECVGRIALKPLDRTNRIELQLLLFPMYWRKGFGVEAARQVLNGFLPRPVYALFPKAHEAAVGLAKKLGFVEVGPAYYYERPADLWMLAAPEV
jgi:RimJ/RimL family protein N-acetyltransferase